MNHPIAQIFALTCYGNAFLGGKKIPRFFPENSTCKFCDSVNFVELKHGILGQAKEVEVARTPDEWIESLPERGTQGIRLTRQADDKPEISDRNSVGFIGGGGTWIMELTSDHWSSELWSARWDVWNQNAPERRIWRVSYGMLRQTSTQPNTTRQMAIVKKDFRDALHAILRFAEREDCGGFAKSFANAITAIENPSADIGYHKDLTLPGQLCDDALAMLKASMSAWVFGGMGSWNDLGFDGVAQQEYESLSENLFNLLNETIEAIANSTLPQH